MLSCYTLDIYYTTHIAFMKVTWDIQTPMGSALRGISPEGTVTLDNVQYNVRALHLPLFLPSLEGISVYECTCECTRVRTSVPSLEGMSAHGRGFIALPTGALLMKIPASSPPYVHNLILC